MRISLVCLLIATSLTLAAGTAPIRLDPHNPHYFSYDGQTIVLLTSGEHYGAVINPDFDFTKYLSALHADGLNYTRLFGGSYVEAFAKSFGIRYNTLAPAEGRFLPPWARSNASGYAGGGNKFDLDHWNAKYFDRLRSFLSEAQSRGVIVELTFFSSQYAEQQWALSPFNNGNNVNGTDAIDWRNVNTLKNGNILRYQEAYVRKLVATAKEFPNVIFEIANEPWSDRPVTVDVINPYLPSPGRNQYPNSVDVADDATAAWEARVAEWIAAEDNGTHLVAQNYCNFLFPVKALVAGVNIVNFHYAYPEAVRFNYGLGKAISYDESGFLGTADAAYIRQAWNFMLSGGSTFDGLDYSFTVGHEDGTETRPNGPGGGSSAFRHSLKALADLLRRLPLGSVHPDSAIVQHAAGVYFRILSAGDGQYAAYLDGAGPTALQLQLASGNYVVEWIDPATGARVQQAQVQSNGGAVTLNTPDFKNGLALYLERERP